MSFYGVTQGSVHEVQVAKESKGYDWDINPASYNKMYPHGMNQNYNLGKVDSDRNKLLSSHQYNPYITTCAEPLPGEDWLRPPEAYETYRLKGMTNDQSFAMPKFNSTSTEFQAKVHENQHNMYRQFNPFKDVLEDIPKAMANAESVKEEEARVQQYYKRVGDGEQVDSLKAPGALKFDNEVGHNPAMSGNVRPSTSPQSEQPPQPGAQPGTSPGAQPAGQPTPTEVYRDIGQYIVRRGEAANTALNEKLSVRGYMMKQPNIDATNLALLNKEIDYTKTVKNEAFTAFQEFNEAVVADDRDRVLAIASSLGYSPSNNPNAPEEKKNAPDDVADDDSDDGTIIPDNASTTIMDPIDSRGFQSAVSNDVQKQFGKDFIEPNNNQRTYVLFEKRGNQFFPLKKTGMNAGQIRKFVGNKTGKQKSKVDFDLTYFNHTGDGQNIPGTDYYAMMYTKSRVKELNLQPGMAYAISKPDQSSSSQSAQPVALSRTPVPQSPSTPSTRTQQSVVDHTNRMRRRRTPSTQASRTQASRVITSTPVNRYSAPVAFPAFPGSPPNYAGEDDDFSFNFVNF
jgi:hypothetical protein